MILGWAHGKFCAMCPKSLVMPLSLTYEFKALITKKTSDEGTLSCFIEVESLPYYVVQYYERDWLSDMLLDMIQPFILSGQFHIQNKSDIFVIVSFQQIFPMKVLVQCICWLPSYTVAVEIKNNVSVYNVVSVPFLKALLLTPKHSLLSPELVSESESGVWC